MKLNGFNLFWLIKKKIIASFSICIFIFCFACKKENHLTTAYKSDFTKTEKTSFPELEYWTNNTQEWQIAKNRIECLVSKENRKTLLLTRQLGNQQGNLEMKVRLGFFNNKISSLNKNWAGFQIGSNSNLIDDSNNFKKGINIGICTNGALFIGSPSPNHKNNTIINALQNGVDLKILIGYNDNGYTLDFSVLEIKSGKVLGRISKKEIAPEQITGDFALVSNFENSEINKITSTKSVWFQDWEIKGSKVALP